MTTARYAVRGLTCGRCIAEVMDSVRGLTGVTRVSVALVRGGPSPVTVTSEPAASTDTVRGAVRQAGFDLVIERGNRRGAG